MKDKFNNGDKKVFQRKILSEDTAKFEEGEVHPVYSTFAIARDAEWTCRLFALEMKESEEEGIGTFVSVEHQSPAFVGEEVEFEAIIESVTGNEIVCSYVAKVGKRIIAMGKQKQKILLKERIVEVFKEAKNG